MSLPSPSLRSRVVLACGGVSSRPSPTTAGFTGTFMGFGWGFRLYWIIDGCSPAGCTSRAGVCTSRGTLVVCMTTVAEKGFWYHMLRLPPLRCVLTCTNILILSTKTRQGEIYVNYEKFQDKKTYEGTNLKKTSQPAMTLCCRSAEFLQIEAKNMRLKYPTVMRLFVTPT